MKLLYRWAVLGLFLVALWAIMLFLPQDFTEAVGDGFQFENMDRVQVTAGGETTLLEREDEAFSQLVMLLNEQKYSRSFTADGPAPEDAVILRFPNGDDWRWEFYWGADSEAVTLGPAFGLKAYTVEDAETFQTAMEDFLEELT